MLLFQLLEGNPLIVIPWVVALLIAITVHEFSHGFAAYLLGDTTAYDDGRLTLNPVAHLDLMGSLLLILVGFGWAKPVPINPMMIRKGWVGQCIVAFAGVFSNIAIAIFAAILLKLVLVFGDLDQMNFLVKFLSFLTYINVALFVFNLLPIAPLDGYRIFEAVAPRAFQSYAPFIERYGFFIIILLVFLTNIVGVLIALALRLFSIIFGIDL